MRLVDADALESETCCGCKNYEHKYANCIDCALANTPTIDAVPVEWLISQVQSYTNDWKDIGRVVNNGVIKGIISKWQKEQEAR